MFLQKLICFWETTLAMNHYFIIHKLTKKAYNFKNGKWVTDIYSGNFTLALLSTALDRNIGLVLWNQMTWLNTTEIEWKWKFNSKSKDSPIVNWRDREVEYSRAAFLASSSSAATSISSASDSSSSWFWFCCGCCCWLVLEKREMWWGRERLERERERERWIGKKREGGLGMGIGERRERVLERVVLELEE